MMPSNSVSRWLLPVSLAFNAFLGGIIVGHFDHRPFGPPHGPPGPAEMADRMARDLPPPDAAILRQAFAAHAAEMTQSEQAMHGFPDRVRAVLEAPDFDAGALKEVLDGMRTARDRRDDAMAASLLDATARMSPDGRKHLAFGRPPRP